MGSIKDWLDLAKQSKLKVINVSETDEVAICVNVLSIPNSNVAAVTVTVTKDQKKKNALPSWVFAKVMRIFEKTLWDINDNLAQSSQCFKPVGLNTEWYKILDCHRIFFIPETSVPDFISTFLSRNRLNVIKVSGVSEVFLVVNTTQYYFVSNF